jgi:RES domain-containing protein
VLEKEEADLPEDWDKRPYGSASQKVGNAWIESEASLVLRVPSVVEPREYNYLIHPKHPEIGELTIGEPEPLDFLIRE